MINIIKFTSVIVEKCIWELNRNVTMVKHAIIIHGILILQFEYTQMLYIIIHLYCYQTCLLCIESQICNSSIWFVKCYFLIFWINLKRSRTFTTLHYNNMLHIITVIVQNISFCVEVYPRVIYRPIKMHATIICAFLENNYVTEYF